MLLSPTNLHAFARSAQLAAQRFGLRTQRDLHELSIEMCTADQLALSAMTNLTECESLPRRSILLVPAMTGRTQDYALFAQSAYLANGISMAFANAVTSKGGGSCFVGQDSWDGSFATTSGPYHGVQPGLYRHRADGRGALSTFEEALVVADIDPHYALGGRPNPEALPPGLELVAHIPILASWRSSLRSTVVPKHEAISGWAAQVHEVHRRLADALQGRGYRSTVDDAEPRRLAAALRELEVLRELGQLREDPPSWLGRRRQAYASEHGQKPQAWPPPVALDFLTVDLGAVEDDAQPGRFPPIEVPARSAQGPHDAPPIAVDGDDPAD
ncbi:MAG: hypothetical protein AAGM22_13380 [Acidobacteriota bacterium]